MRNLRREWFVLGIAAVGLAVPRPADAFLLLQEASGFSSGRTISGTNVAGGWMVFQPFDVPAPGWAITTIGFDGWLAQDPGNVGISGTLYADDGTGNAPNEAVVLSSATYFPAPSSGGSNWRDEAHNVTIGAGRFWVRWSANDADAWAAAFLSNNGLASWSRRLSDGARFDAGPTALRIDGEVVPEPASMTVLALGTGLVALRRRRRA